MYRTSSRRWTITDFIDRHLNLIFPSAAVLVILGLMIYPLFYSSYLSLHQWRFGDPAGPKFVGLSNFRDLIVDARFMYSLLRTLYYSGFCLATEIPFGLAIALILNRPFKARRFIRVIFLLPILATPVAIALIWVIMLNPSMGILNYFLKSLGLPPSLWVASASTVIPTLVMVDIWRTTPFVALIMLGGLQSLPVTPYEAGRIDGASKLQLFRYVTLPLMRSTIMVALLLRTMDSLKVFAMVYTMTSGGPGHASEFTYLFAYDTSFKYFKMGYGAAAIMIFLAVIMAISFLLTRLRRRE